jgi:hypothetical protein
VRQLHDAIPTTISASPAARSGSPRGTAIIALRALRLANRALPDLGRQFNKIAAYVRCTCAGDSSSATPNESVVCLASFFHTARRSISIGSDCMLRRGAQLLNRSKKRHSVRD